MRSGAIVCLLALVMGAGRAEAKVKEKSIQQLPRDAWELAFVWTEPIKCVLKESRRFDPVSGLWFGIVEGSVKSVERTAGFFLPGDKDREGSEVDSGKVLIRYTF